MITSQPSAPTIGSQTGSFCVLLDTLRRWVAGVRDIFSQARQRHANAHQVSVDVEPNVVRHCRKPLWLLRRHAGSSLEFVPDCLIELRARQPVGLGDHFRRVPSLKELGEVRC